MQAIRSYQYGSPNVLRIEDIPTPQPGSDQMLLEVACCGVNPADWKI